jgi:hypothetical protein
VRSRICVTVCAQRESKGVTQRRWLRVSSWPLKTETGEGHKITRKPHSSITMVSWCSAWAGLSFQLGNGHVLRSVKEFWTRSQLKWVWAVRLGLETRLHLILPCIQGKVSQNELTITTALMTPFLQTSGTAESGQNFLSGKNTILNPSSQMVLTYFEINLSIQFLKSLRNDFASQWSVNFAA